MEIKLTEVDPMAFRQSRLLDLFGRFRTIFKDISGCLR